MFNIFNQLKKKHMALGHMKLAMITPHVQFKASVEKTHVAVLRVLNVRTVSFSCAVSLVGTPVVLYEIVIYVPDIPYDVICSWENTRNHFSF